MIVSWIHKGLKDFFETGSMAGIQAEHAKRLRVRLEILNAIRSLDEMNYPSFRLHALQGDRKGSGQLRSLKIGVLLSSLRTATFTLLITRIITNDKNV